MQSVYRISPEVFDRWCPAGTPARVAEFVAPYIDAGALDISLIARGQDIPHSIESVAEVRRLLAAR
jgi:alkanesulfonate monooxygenase SsuD/methylene tetrahydromethanopterin reductase-like flavin-dependent oxidoreductase (luciferase family)